MKQNSKSAAGKYLPSIKSITSTANPPPKKSHESINCTEPYRCVNCKPTHPSYSSRACEKWKLEKAIQTVCTKQNIPYLEARKIVESRTPIVGTSYATATAQSSNRKTYGTTKTQTDLPVNSISKLQKTAENINKTPKNLRRTQKITESSSLKLPLHRRNKPNTTTTITKKQTRKSASGKSLPSVKLNLNRTNSPCLSRHLIKTHLIQRTTAQ